MTHASVAKYESIQNHANAEGLPPYQIIQILMAGTIEKLNKARAAMVQENIVQKGENLSQAISLIEALKASLDFSHGSEIAMNLDNLYSYMVNQLIAANLHNQIAPIDEVSNLMKTIKSGWDEINDLVD